MCWSESYPGCDIWHNNSLFCLVLKVVVQRDCAVAFSVQPERAFQKAVVKVCMHTTRCALPNDSLSVPLSNSSYLCVSTAWCFLRERFISVQRRVWRPMSGSRSWGGKWWVCSRAGRKWDVFCFFLTVTQTAAGPPLFTLHFFCCVILTHFLITEKYYISSNSDLLLVKH